MTYQQMNEAPLSDPVLDLAVGSQPFSGPEKSPRII